MTDKEPRQKISLDLTYFDYVALKRLIENNPTLKYDEVYFEVLDNLVQKMKSEFFS